MTSEVILNHLVVKMTPEVILNHLAVGMIQNDFRGHFLYWSLTKNDGEKALRDDSHFSRPKGDYLTRSTYWPVRVSIHTRSPGFTNRGTLTTAPVSSVAGLVTLLAVSPRTPGSALSTVNSRKLGSSTEIMVSLSTSISTVSCSFRKRTASPSISFGMGC